MQTDEILRRQPAARFLGRAFVASAVFAAVLAVWFAARGAAAQQASLSITGGPAVTAITQDSAVIRWTTGEASTTVVRFGATAAMSESQRKVVIVPGAAEEEAFEISHSLTLQELKPATTYYYAVESAAQDGRTASSAQSTFTTAGASAPLTGVTLASPAAGAKFTDAFDLRAVTSGPAAAVDFTVTTSTGTKVTKVGGANSGDNLNWLFGGMKLQPGSFQVSATATGKDAAGAAVTFDSAPVMFAVQRACTAADWSCGPWGECGKPVDGKAMQTRTCTRKADCAESPATTPVQQQMCLPSPGCTSDIWSCGEWSACSAEGKKNRKCTLTEDCPTATTPKPEETAACEPVCTADIWTCSDWGKCDKERKERRVCSLSFDCPNVTVPEKPQEARPCMFTPGNEDVNAPAVENCDKDLWSCGEWGECKDGGNGPVRARTCTLADDCPFAETPKPEETEKCEAPSAASASQPSLKDAGVFVPVALSPQEASVGHDQNEPAGALYEVSLVGVDDPAMQRELVRECRAGGILAERCAAWLAAKYADRSCAAQGAFTKETCEKALTAGHGGIFPGCEGKSAAECDGVRARAMIGYMPGDAKAKLDAVVGTGDVAGAMDALGGAAPGLLAVREDKKDAADWWPSVVKGGMETSSSMIIIDTDKDGLADDLEKRLGTDPRVPDVATGGKVDGKETRELLKALFADGEIPTQEFVFVDTDGDGKADLIEDRKILGLRKFDPTKVYQAGDTVAFDDGKKVNKLPGGSFEKGDKPTEPQFGIDLDGDGRPEATMTSRLLRNFFEKGDKPTQEQFGVVDRALMTGAPLEQPLGGTGEVDKKITVEIVKPAAGGETLNETNDVNRRTIGGAQDCYDACGRRCGANASCLTECRANCRAGQSGGALGRADSPDVCRIECEARNCNAGNAASFQQCSLKCADDCGVTTAAPTGASSGIARQTDADVNAPSDINGAAPAAAVQNVLRGRAAPNATVLLYVYSYVPMVLTTTTDENGDFSYDVGDSIGDGEHTVYVALTDDTGKIAKKSEPLSFFVKEAKAVSQDEFTKPDVNVAVEPVAQAQRFYLMGAAGAIILGLAAAWFVVGRRMKEAPPAPPAPTE
jgi:hypothetical protein